VHVVRLGVEFLQFGLEVRAHVPHDLLKPHGVPTDGHGMPVLDDEIQYE
jgi:hypothetical protein